MSEEKKMVKIGSYEPGNPPVINREYYRQGWVVKDDKAFYDTEHPDRVCYVPELSDMAYSRNDFLKLTDGLIDLAEELYEESDWQHPESTLDDWLMNGEIVQCPECKKIVWIRYGDDKQTCPHCGCTFNESDA